MTGRASNVFVFVVVVIVVVPPTYSPLPRFILELYLPYAPLPGGGGILPAVSSGPGSGGCRPVLLGGVDLSMSAAVQPVAALPALPSSGPPPPPPHNPLHHTGGGLALPALGSAPVMMPRPPTTVMPPLGPSLPPSHQDDLAEAAPNQDVLLALLARNKNLEGKDSFQHPFFSPPIERCVAAFPTISFRSRDHWTSFASLCNRVRYTHGFPTYGFIIYFSYPCRVIIFFEIPLEGVELGNDGEFVPIRRNGNCGTLRWYIIGILQIVLSVGNKLSKFVKQRDFVVSYNCATSTYAIFVKTMLEQFITIV